jgi:hypothetical protein
VLIDDLLLCRGRRTVRITVYIEDFIKEIPSIKALITKREDPITGEYLDTRLEKTPLLWSQWLILLFSRREAFLAMRPYTAIISMYTSDRC